MIDSYSVIYKGKGVSLNQFYAGVHWTERNKIKDTFRDIFMPMIKEQKIPTIEKMELEVEANSRHDVDNLVAMAKIFMDCVKHCYIIRDDDASQYKAVTLKSNKEDLEYNEFKFTIKVLEYGD